MIGPSFPNADAGEFSNYSSLLHTLCTSNPWSVETSSNYGLRELR